MPEISRSQKSPNTAEGRRLTRKFANARDENEVQRSDQAMLRHHALSRARPLLLSTLSRQVPARVVHRRLLCSEPKKPSGAFDAFFPKKGKPKKGHEKKASGSASGEASESSKAAGESSSSSSDPANAARAFFGGGGSGDGPPQWQRGLLAEPWPAPCYSSR